MFNLDVPRIYLVTTRAITNEEQILGFYGPKYGKSMKNIALSQLDTRTKLKHVYQMRRKPVSNYLELTHTQVYCPTVFGEGNMVIRLSVWF